MQKLPGKYIFTIGEKRKTTKPGKHLEPIELTAFEPDINLCVVTHLDQYLAITENLRGSTSQLLISYVKPHQAVSNATIGKWSKSVLKDAGIDVTEFTKWTICINLLCLADQPHFERNSQSGRLVKRPDIR